MFLHLHQIHHLLVLSTKSLKRNAAWFVLHDLSRNLCRTTFMIHYMQEWFLRGFLWTKNQILRTSRDMKLQGAQRYVVAITTFVISFSSSASSTHNELRLCNNSFFPVFFSSCILTFVLQFSSFSALSFNYSRK